jgi:hypothetical protein
MSLLAVSLHGATDEVREQLMPINRKYPIATLLEACAYYTARKKQRIAGAAVRATIRRSGRAASSARQRMAQRTEWP